MLCYEDFIILMGFGNFIGRILFIVENSIFEKNPLKTTMKAEDDLLVRVTGLVGIQVDATELFAQGDVKFTTLLARIRIY